MFCCTVQTLYESHRESFFKSFKFGTILYSILCLITIGHCAFFVLFETFTTSCVTSKKCLEHSHFIIKSKPNLKKVIGKTAFPWRKIVCLKVNCIICNIVFYIFCYVLKYFFTVYIKLLYEIFVLVSVLEVFVSCFINNINV